MIVKEIMWKIATKISTIRDRDSWLIINPTLKCNVECSYCSIHNSKGVRADIPEIPWEKWTKIIGDKKRVGFSGGEPLVYKDIVPLVEWCVKNKKIVKIYTNLKSTRLTKLVLTWRIRLESVYHSEQIDKDVFLDNLSRYKKLFYVGVTEFIGDEPLGIKSKKKIKYTGKRLLEINEGCKDQYGPDGKFYPGDPYYEGLEAIDKRLKALGE